MTPGFAGSSQLTSKIHRFPAAASCVGGEGGSSDFSPATKVAKTKEATTRWVFEVMGLELRILEVLLSSKYFENLGESRLGWQCRRCSRRKWLAPADRISRGLRMTGAVVWWDQLGIRTCWQLVGACCQFHNCRQRFTSLLTSPEIKIVLF